MLLNILAIYFSILAQSVDKETQWKASLEMASLAMAMALIFHIWFTQNKVCIQLHLLKLQSQGKPKELIEILNKVEQGVMILKPNGHFELNGFRFQVIN